MIIINSTGITNDNDIVEFTDNNLISTGTGNAFNFPSCLIINTESINISSGVYTQLTYNTISFDTSDMGDLSDNYIRIPREGRYYININFYPSIVGTSYNDAIELFIGITPPNGTINLTDSTQKKAYYALPNNIALSDTYHLQISEIFDLSGAEKIYAAVTASILLGGSYEARTDLSVHYIGH